jgi:hypothetical protein
MKDTTVRSNPTQSQHQAGAGFARVHAYPCAMTRGSWLVVPFLGIATDPKPRPRRITRIS